MLNIDASGERSRQVSNELLVWRILYKWILTNNIKNFFGLLFEIGGCKLLSVLLSLFSEVELVHATSRALRTSRKEVPSFPEEWILSFQG